MDEKVFSVSAKDLMRTDFLSVQGNNSASDLTGKLVNSKYNNVVVLDGNKYYGMASLRALLRKRLDLTKMKAKSLTEKKPSIKPDAGFLKVVDLMRISNARLLPVIENEKIIGVVPIQRVVELIKDIKVLENMSAGEIASHDVITIKEDDTLDKAMRLMSEKQIKRLIVLRGFRISGILEYKDVVKKMMSSRHEGKKGAKHVSKGHNVMRDSTYNIPVSSFMNTNIPLINGKDNIGAVIDVIRKNGLAIIESNLRPKGIITNNTLLEAVIALKRDVRKIQVIDMPKTDDIDYSIIESTITKFYDKIERKVKHEPLLRIHFKERKKEGLRRMHSIKLMLSFAGNNLTVSAEGWTLITVLQDAFKTLENKMQKSLRD